MKKIYISAVLSALAAASCATYTENGLFGGFSETPLASDTFRIQASGNAYTSRNKTNAIAMVRAAEPAQQHGYHRFVVLDFDEWAKTSFYTSPSTATTSTNFNATAYGYGYGNYSQANLYGHANSTTTIDPGQTYAIEKPRTDMVVRFVPNSSQEASRALLATDIFARYGKTAGYKPKEFQPSQTPALITPTNPAQYQAINEIVQEQTPVTEVAVEAAPAAFNRVPDGRAKPTLDEVYKSLSPGLKARINSLPPAQRADALMQIRDGTY